MTHKTRWIAVAGGLLAVGAPAPAQAVQFSAPTQVPFSSAPRDVVLADIDGDGLEDLVVADATGAVVLRGAFTAR